MSSVVITYQDGDNSKRVTLDKDDNGNLLTYKKVKFYIRRFPLSLSVVINGTNPSLYSVAIRLPRLFAIPANLRHLSAFSICLQNMERFAFLVVAAASSSCNDIVIANVHL